MRSATFGPTPGVRATAALSRSAMALARSDGRQRAEHGERDLGADALHGLQQAEPFALDVGAEAEQLDLVLAHIGLDRQHRGLARRGQRLQRARRAMHLIADALHVEDHVVLAVGIDQALELADHLRRRTRRDASCACRSARSTLQRVQPIARRLAVMRMGDGDGQRVGGVGGFRIGLRQQQPTITRIWFLSAWPAPTTVFLTWFGAYSATGRPSIAGASIATPRACPSFRVATRVLVDEGLLDRGLGGRKSPQHLRRALDGSPADVASGRLSGGSTEPQATNDQPVALDRRSRPSRCGAGRDRCRGCESEAVSWASDSAGAAKNAIATGRSPPSLRANGSRRRRPETGSAKQSRAAHVRNATGLLRRKAPAMTAGGLVPGRSAARPGPGSSAHLRISASETSKLRVDVLHVVVLVEQVDQPQELLAGLVVDRRRCSAASRSARPCAARRISPPAPLRPRESVSCEA